MVRGERSSLNSQFWRVNSGVLGESTTCSDPMGIVDWGDVLFNCVTARSSDQGD